MWRASIERPRTVHQWRKRLDLDADLEPGRFRKGRTPLGCPRHCAHCRAKKLEQTRQELRADLSETEWRQDMN